jgi:fatty-acyl-CoA synthase
VSFGALLHQLAAQRPNALALSWRDPAGTAPDGPWAQLTYAGLANRVNAIATQLAPSLQRGDRVAWLGLNHPAQLALLFALARLGAVLVPLNHRLSPAEWCAVLQDCAPTLLVHDDTLAMAAHELPHRLEQPLALWPVQALSTASEPARPSDAGADGLDTPLLLVYTSGTTGQPKGAVHTQGNLLANMAIAAQVQGLSADDTVLTVLPLFHVGGLGIQTLPALSVGAHVLLFARFDATATLACIQHERPTLTLQVPATLQALTSHPQWAATDMSGLRAVWAGSSLLPPSRCGPSWRGACRCAMCTAAPKPGRFPWPCRPRTPAATWVRAAGQRRGWTWCCAMRKASQWRPVPWASCGCARPTWCAATGPTALRWTPPASSTPATWRNRRPTAATPWWGGPKT